MDHVYEAYCLFYDHLTKFVVLLAARLHPEAPTALRFVTDIPVILPKNDPHFVTGDVQKVVDKCSLVLELTEKVVSVAPTFVISHHQDWLTTAGGRLTNLSRFVIMSLMSLRLADDGTSTGISFLPDGLSGVNTGVISGIDYQTSQNLSELVKFLETTST